MPPAEDPYLGWLYHKVQINRPSTPTNSYYNLMRVLHTTEFVWLLSGDDNRAEDGRELREEFARLSGLPNESIEECSVLEMFVALSLRAEFQTDTPHQEWFWEFISNLGLEYYNDARWRSDEPVQDILDTFIWRRYQPDGTGSPFPLREPEEDMTQVQLWYQFWAYLKDQDRLL